MIESNPQVGDVCLSTFTPFIRDRKALDMTTQRSLLVFISLFAMGTSLEFQTTKTGFQHMMGSMAGCGKKTGKTTVSSGAGGSPGRQQCTTQAEKGVWDTNTQKGGSEGDNIVAVKNGLSFSSVCTGDHKIECAGQACFAACKRENSNLVGVSFGQKNWSTTGDCWCITNNNGFNTIVDKAEKEFDAKKKKEPATKPFKKTDELTNDWFTMHACHFQAPCDTHVCSDRKKQLKPIEDAKGKLCASTKCSKNDDIQCCETCKLQVFDGEANGQSIRDEETVKTHKLHLNYGLNCKESSITPKCMGGLCLKACQKVVSETTVAVSFGMKGTTEQTEESDKNEAGDCKCITKEYDFQAMTKSDAGFTNPIARGSQWNNWYTVHACNFN